VWDDLQVALEDRLGQPVKLTVARDGEPERAMEVPGSQVKLGREGTLDLFALGFSPDARSTVVSVVDPGSPAAKAGLATGDAITEVDGKKVQTWEELEAALTPDAAHAITTLRRSSHGDPAKSELRLEPDPAWTRPAWDTLGDTWGLEYPAVVIGVVNPDSAALEAGVQPGDRILAIDGTAVDGWDDVLVLVAKTARENDVPRPLKLDLYRSGQTLSLEFQPRWEQSIARGGVVHYRPLLGIARYPDSEIVVETISKKYSFPQAASRAASLTSEAFRTLLQLLWNMVTYQMKVTDALGGPVAIVREAGEAAQNGIFTYVRTMALISLSLGVVNLVPFPVLDGGQIVFYAIEGIRGRPLPVAIRDRIQMIGVLALVALFLIITVKDVSMWIGG
jgi:regulator of sigma E protease